MLPHIPSPYLIASAIPRQVQEVVKGVCRNLRRVRPSFLPHLYLSALKTAWEQVRASRQKWLWGRWVGAGNNT